MSEPGTIHVEDSTVLAQTRYEARQYVTRLLAPKCAAHARPGSFAHITCDPAVPMRRPLSIMRVSRSEGWADFLYKAVGTGLRHLAARRPGDTVSLMGPIGQPFHPHPERPRTLLVGGGVGIPPMVFLAETLHGRGGAWRPLVLMGSEVPFPFELAASRIRVAGIDSTVSACVPLIEQWGIASRLASLAGYSGCYVGFVTELAELWLAALPRTELAEVEVFACGPEPMLQAAAQLARRYQLPCQVALEEFMACATGGCAGCAVRVQTPEGPAMKRVCVDGPVFEASSVF